MQIPGHNRFALRCGFPLPSVASMPPALTALMIQLLALLMVTLIAAAASALTQERVAGHFQWALLHGIIAAAIGRRLGMAVWWPPIHLVFAPALVAALTFAWHPLWFLSGFIIFIIEFNIIKIEKQT